MDGRCGTCKHWFQWSIKDDEGRDDWGLCQRIQDPPSPLIVYCSEGGTITTAPEFGCVLHEPIVKRRIQIVPSNDDDA